MQNHLNYCYLMPLNLHIPYHREEIPPEEDQWEKATNQGVDRQAAAVGHLEDGERVLWVYTGAVSVRQSPRRQRKGRGTLPAGPKLLLWENLPQELRNIHSHRNVWREKALYRRGCTVWEDKLKQFWEWCGTKGILLLLSLWLVCTWKRSRWIIGIWECDRSKFCFLFCLCLYQPTGRRAHVSFQPSWSTASAGCICSSHYSLSFLYPRSPVLFCRHVAGEDLTNSWSELDHWLVKQLLVSEPEKRFHRLCTVCLCWAVF